MRFAIIQCIAKCNCGRGSTPPDPLAGFKGGGLLRGGERDAKAGCFGGDKIWGLGTEVPQRGQGQSHGGGLGAKPPQAEDMLITIAIMC